MSSANTKPAWRIALPILSLLLVATLVFYQHTVLYLISLWNQLDVGEYAHGYLVLAISAYLIFNLREKLLQLAPGPEYRALVIVIAASLLWLLAALVDVEMLQAAALLILVFALVWSVLGTQVIRLLAFPILFIAFAIPVWFPLSPLLQNLTADTVFAVIRLLGVPAFRQDNLIVLPAGSISIEQACSGLRYLLTALTLGALYAYLNYSTLRARLLTVLVAAASALLANMLRVFIVVYLAYKTEMQHPLVREHLSLGWYLFAGLMAILLLVDTYLQKKHPVVTSSEQTGSPAIKLNVHQPAYPHCILFAVITGLLIVVAPVVVDRSSLQPITVAGQTAPELPQAADGWRQSLTSNDNWNPVYHGAVNLKRSYQKDKNTVVLYMGYYPVQKQGEELINELNYINNKDVWRTTYAMARRQIVANQQVLEQLLVHGSKQQRLVWYWYNVAGNVTTKKFEAKLLQALGLFTGKYSAFVVAVAVQTSDDVDVSRQVLQDFILAIQDPMENSIERISVHH